MFFFVFSPFCSQFGQLSSFLTAALGQMLIMLLVKLEGCCMERQVSGFRLKKILLVSSISLSRDLVLFLWESQLVSFSQLMRCSKNRFLDCRMGGSFCLFRLQQLDSSFLLLILADLKRRFYSIWLLTFIPWFIYNALWPIIIASEIVSTTFLFGKGQSDLGCSLLQLLLLNFMSVTRKRLDRKHFIEKLEQVKFDWQGEAVKLTFGQTAKRGNSSQSRKSKQKSRQNILMTQKEMLISKANKHRYPLDRSKQSKESKQSIPKSIQSYHLVKGKGKRSRSVTDKYLHTHKSKEFTSISNAINSTFQMQSAMSTHNKKQSNLSSTNTKPQLQQSYIKALASPQAVNLNEQLKVLVFKSQSVLQRYRAKNDELQQENKLYKRKYHQALKKIRHLQNRN